MYKVQLKVTFFLAKEHSLRRRRYVPLERIYQASCPSDDEAYRATTMKTPDTLIKQGLTEKRE